MNAEHDLAIAMLRNERLERVVVAAAQLRSDHPIGELDAVDVTIRSGDLRDLYEAIGGCDRPSAVGYEDSLPVQSIERLVEQERASAERHADEVDRLGAILSRKRAHLMLERAASRP